MLVIRKQTMKVPVRPACKEDDWDFVFETGTSSGFTNPRRTRSRNPPSLDVGSVNDYHHCFEFLGGGDKNAM